MARELIENQEPDPKPPGVTARIRFYKGPNPDIAKLDLPGVAKSGWWDWTAFLDGADPDDACIWTERRFPTYEDAEAHCREQMTELVARLLPDLEREDIDVQLNFVRE